MDNLQALAIVLKLDKVSLIMSKLSTDLRNICNLNSAITALSACKLLQTVKEFHKTRKCCQSINCSKMHQNAPK
mgnify:CR=1 FL=1